MTTTNQPLANAISEYTSAIVGGGNELSNTTKDGVVSLTKMIYTTIGQVDEMNLCTSLLENDSIVLRDALLPQLASNTEHLLSMFQSIDALGALVDQLERTTREIRDQVKQTQSGYNLRHPKKVEKWIGSLNMFRSKKNNVNIAGSVKPPMPELAPINIPDTTAAISSLQ